MFDERSFSSSSFDSRSWYYVVVLPVAEYRDIFSELKFTLTLTEGINIMVTADSEIIIFLTLSEDIEENMVIDSEIQIDLVI